MKKILLTAMAVLLLNAGTASAGQFDDASAAYKRGDYATAVAKLRPLAARGDARAQSNLGLMYSMAQGVVYDGKESAKWYRMAAAQGNARAQFNLGLMYNIGQGVAQNDTESVKWYRLAAEQGEADAQLAVGDRYRKGLGVTQDSAEAEKWYRLAAAQGNTDAQAALDNISVAQGPAKNDAVLTTQETEVQRTTLAESRKNLLEGKSDEQSSSHFDLAGPLICWILLIGGPIGYLALRSKKRDHVMFAARSSDELVGIKGWLRFFVISMGILRPVLCFGAVADTFAQLEAANSPLALSTEWGTYKAVTWLALGLFFAFNIYVALQMRFTWTSSSVTLAKVAVTAWPIGAILIDLVIPQMILKDAVDVINAKGIGQIIISIISSAIWLLYLSKSKRVRATYIEQRFDKHRVRIPPVTMEEPNERREVPKEVSVELSLPSYAREVDKAEEEKMYDEVGIELESGSLHKSTWLKAFAQANGDENVAKATYIKLRIEKLRAEKLSENAA